MDSSLASALPALVGGLAAHSRRQRQAAAQKVYSIAKEDPSAILPYLNDLLDALGRPEAQTRWEVLDTLTLVAQAHPQEVQPGIDAAETSLFDEDSAPVRLAAFRFLAAYGSTSEARSDEVWPLLDEAIQCYHGDAEYRDMLVALYDMVQGPISEKCAHELLDRIAFDTKSGASYIQALSENIAKELKGKVH